MSNIDDQYRALIDMINTAKMSQRKSIDVDPLWVKGIKGRLTKQGYSIGSQWTGPMTGNNPRGFYGEFVTISW